MIPQLIKFQTMGDDRGSLIALESGRNVPFDIRRVYYIFGTEPDVKRGCRAHRDLSQVLVCVSGSCVIRLDDGRSQAEVVLNHPSLGLLVENMVWREMYDFSSDCVLLVLANRLYDPADYIRDYSEFRDIVNQRFEREKDERR